MSTDDSANTSKARDFADKSVEQARGAIGTLLEAARKTAEAIQTNTKTTDTPEGQAVAKGFGYAEQNITAIFDFAQKLIRTSDLKGAVELQADFVRSQAAAMEKQVAELKSLSKTDKT